MTTTVHRVAGMNCRHCLTSVSGEISKLPGVTDVAVDLHTGAVTIPSTDELEPDQVRVAVNEAGYELAS